MWKLLKRWYVWLGLVLLLGMAGSVALIYANPGRITQANFDRIQDGMSLEEVEEILGRLELDKGTWRGSWVVHGNWVVHDWHNGPNWIAVRFLGGSANRKELHLATPWETLTWYAKTGAAKIGVKWD
jgi:hypothetical protein